MSQEAYNQSYLVLFRINYQGHKGSLQIGVVEFESHPPPMVNVRLRATLRKAIKDQVLFGCVKKNTKVEVVFATKNLLRS